MSPVVNQSTLAAIRADRQCLLAAAGGVFFLLTTAIAMLLFSHAAWEGVYRGRVESLTRLSATLSENVRRVFDSGDQTIRLMRHEYRQAGRTDTLPALGAELNRIDRLWHQVAIADRNGVLVATTVPMAAAAMRAINLADRPHFLWHAGHDEDVPRVSPVLVGRASGRPSIQLSRRLNKPQAGFGGIIVASCSPQYFLDYFARIATAGDRVIGISLIGDDGITRAHVYRKTVDYGVQLGADSLFEKTRKIGAGHVEYYSRVDGELKLYVFEGIEEYGLKLFLSTPLADLRAQWWEGVRGFLLLGLLLMAITIGATVSIVRLRLSEVGAMAALRARESDLEAANAFQARMIASVSHELRTPLTSILGYAYLVAGHRGDAEIREFGKIICAAGEHLRMVINGILDLSRKEKDQHEASFTDIDVRELLAQSAGLFSITARQKGIDLILDIADSVPASFPSDHTRLAQIVENLLSNAIKFTPAGRISVSARMADGDGALVINVTDTGLGIPAADLQKLFQAFHHVNTAEHQKQQGAGLGLNIVQEFAALLGGTVTVTSAPGAGSSFTVTLPNRRHT